MSQRSLERQPLMDVGNLSQTTDSGEAKKAPVPVVSTTSQVIDLCTEADMTFAFNQAVLPVVANKPKAKAPAKPRVTAPKPATSKPKAPAATKKAKKSKVDVEFDKLAPLEQLEFLRGKAQLLEQLEQDPLVQNATAGEATEAPVTTSTNATSSDDMQLCTLRLELGAVLSTEAELRAKERKIRLQIKRLQRKMTMALPPIVVTHRETVPQNSIANALFIAPCLGASIALSTGVVESVNNLNDTPRKAYQPTDKPLWRLAQQDAQFESAVAPRLLSVERDAVLLPELPQSLAPLSPPGTDNKPTIETPHSPEHDTPAVLKSPVVSPSVMQTKIVNDISSDMYVTSDLCVDENGTSAAQVTIFAEHNNNSNVDIYEVTSSNESNEGDVVEKDCECDAPLCTTCDVTVSFNQETLHIASDEHRNKRQKVHNAELNNNVLSTVRAGLFTNRDNMEESEPVASQSVLTQPHGNNNTSDGVIDLCSPELINQSTKLDSRPIDANYIHNSKAGAGAMEVTSVDASARNSLVLSDSTPTCANCVIHYVPSDYVESSSEEQYLSQSQPIMKNTLRSCISKKLSYSQQSEVNTASQYVSQSQSQPSHTAIPTTTNLSTTNTSSTMHTSLDILTSSILPDFNTMSIVQIREIVQYYGLKEDTRPKMITLLRAMWCRVHGKKSTTSAGTGRGTTDASTAARSSVNASLSVTVNAPTVQQPAALPLPLPPLSQQSVEVQVASEPRLIPLSQLPPPSSQHQLLVSSYLTASNTSTVGNASLCSTNLINSGSGRCSSSQVATATGLVIGNSTTASTTITAAAASNSTKTKTTTATRFELTLADLKQFIRNHDTLYQQVLQYTPIELDTVHASILSTGVFKVSRAKLLEMLDSLAIFVSNTSSRNNNNNGKGGKGKKRKQLSQGSV